MLDTRKDPFLYVIVKYNQLFLSIQQNIAKYRLIDTETTAFNFKIT